MRLNNTSLSRTQKLMGLLKNIQNAVPSMINASITTADGLCVVVLLPGSYNDISRGAVSLSIAYQLTNGLKLGQLQEVVISTTDNVYLIVPVSDEIFVEALLDNDVAVPHLISEIKQKSQLILTVWEEQNTRFD